MLKTGWLSYLCFVSCVSYAQVYQPGPIDIKHLKIKKIRILRETSNYKLFKSIDVQEFSFDTNGNEIPDLFSKKDSTFDNQVLVILRNQKGYSVNIDEIKRDTFNHQIQDTTLDIKGKFFKSIQYLRSNLIIQCLFNDSGNIILERTFSINSQNQEIYHRFIYYNNQGRIVLHQYYSKSKLRPTICSRDKRRHDVHLHETMEYNSLGLMFKCHIKYGKQYHRKKTIKYEFY